MKPLAIGLFLGGVLVLALSACGGGPVDAVPAGGETAQGQSEEGSPTGAPPSQDALQAAWQTSPHADTYVLTAEGTNSTCARCHAPVNWVPTMDDMPESCAACKFEVQPPPPMIAEADWQGIQCNICHQVKREKVDPQVVWLEIAAIEQYAAVTTTTELCQKCHTGGDVPGHAWVAQAGVHQEFACTQCHDAHTAAASCLSAGCHADLSTTAGHDPAHSMVTCAACHDASAARVGPDSSGQWGTWLPVQGGDPVAFNSHALQTESACQRCHYPDNPWTLSVTAQP